MYYYVIAVGSRMYHGSELLTYSSTSPLEPGALVVIELQKRETYGFVVQKSAKPRFATKDIIETLSLPPLPQESIELFLWLSAYYPAPLGITAQLFLPSDTFPKKHTASASGDTPPSTANQTPISLPTLTASQKNALNVISQPGSYILHGETGSGKTRVYIELTKKALDAGQSSIILTPEISLTSQLAQEYRKTFPAHKLIIFHSQLTAATRRNIWADILGSDQPLIIIGPRSALFSPVKNLGLIVVDESHEFAYKQENAPHYHASRVAGKLASLHNAQLVLGSATPSIQDYYLAATRKRPIISLDAIQDKKSEKEVAVVDMRNKAHVSNNHYLSKKLVAEITEKLAGQQQVLVFINRRGTARITLCEQCGWQALCPHCDLPLTYHHDDHILRCHTCGFTGNAPPACPQCRSADIVLKSVGTKSIVTALQKLFPSARIERFDTDSKKGERLHELYDEIHSGNIDILVGTQLLAKGLDLPRLGLVGVINADASLYLPDFSAQERAYQLLYQVIGRVGRSSQNNSASVVIQTYSPENLTIQAAVSEDWKTFYATELKEREDYNFPPFCHVLKISCRRVRAATAQTNAEKFAEILAKQRLAIEIDGPAPAFHEKIHNKYVWQLIIKSKRRGELLKVIDLLPNDWSYDIDPINLL